MIFGNIKKEKLKEVERNKYLLFSVLLAIISVSCVDSEATNSFNEAEDNIKMDIDSINKHYVYYSLDSKGYKSGDFYRINFDGDTVIRGKYYRDTLLGYLNTYDSLGNNRQKVMFWGQNPPTSQWYIRFRDGLIDSVNSCFFQSNIDFTKVYNTHDSLLDIKFHLYCNDVLNLDTHPDSLYHYIRVKSYNNSVDTVWSKNSDFLLTKVGLKEGINRLVFQAGLIKSIQEDTISYFYNDWILFVKRR